MCIHTDSTVRQWLRLSDVYIHERKRREGKKEEKKGRKKKGRKKKGKEKDSGPEAQKVGPERGAGAPARGQAFDEVNGPPGAAPPKTFLHSGGDLCGGLLEIGAFGVGRVAVLGAPA